MASRASQLAMKARESGDQTMLFWSERGEVCCATHAPYPGTDTWRWERWRLLTEEESREWSRQTGRPPKCETCR